jgi:hypothetical protein
MPTIEDHDHIQCLKRGHDSAPREKFTTPLGTHGVHTPELMRTYIHDFYGIK